MLGQHVFVIVVDGAFNVATTELVLEAAVNDGSSVKLVGEAAIEQADECLLGDARQAVRLAFWFKVRKLRLMHVVVVDGRLQAARGTASLLLPQAKGVRALQALSPSPKTRTYARP